MYIILFVELEDAQEFLDAGFNQENRAGAETAELVVWPDWRG